MLLPCYACSIHWFERLVPLLSRRHRVIAVDLLGEGGWEKPASGYSMESEAQDVALALGRLNVQGAVVVGHSLGGAVATALAQQASQLVDRLVIIDQAPDTSFGSLPFLARLSYVPVLGQALRRITPDALVKSTYDDAFAPGYDKSSGFADPDQVVKDFRAMTYTSFDDLQSEEKSFTDAEPLDSRIRTAAVPLLAIFGTEDQIWDDPKAAAEAYSSVPGAKIAMINGAGHSRTSRSPPRQRRSSSASRQRPGCRRPSAGRRITTAPAKPNAAANACRPPRAKSIKVAVKSPEQGSSVKSPVTAHVLSVEPANCQATYSLTVDGTPYDINGPVKARTAGTPEPDGHEEAPPDPKGPSSLQADAQLHHQPLCLLQAGAAEGPARPGRSRLSERQGVRRYNADVGEVHGPLAPAPAGLGPDAAVVEGADPSGIRCFPRWRTSNTADAPSSASHPEHAAGASMSSGAWPGLPHSPWLKTHGTTCSSRQKAAARRAACS